MAQLKRCVVLHGFKANPERHWFPWLTTELAHRGIETHIPALPNSTEPDRAAWVDVARAAIGVPDQDLLIVGHSLGAATALLALDEFDDNWRVGAACMVAGAWEPIPTLPELDDFFIPSADVARTTSRIDRRLSIYSDDDAIVGPELSMSLAKAMESEEILVPGGKHFLGVEGWVELLQLLGWLDG